MSKTRTHGSRLWRWGIAAAVLIASLAPSSGALVITSYNYTAGPIRAVATSVKIRNVSGQPVQIFADLVTSDGTPSPFPNSGQSVAPGAVFFQVKNSPNIVFQVRISANTDRIIPTVTYTDNGGKDHVILPGDMARESSAFSNGASASARILDDATQLASSIGNNTSAFCPEGSVRKDANGVLQMYVTLFSEKNQTVTINHITNRGLFSRTQALQANVRYTEDVNQTLLGTGGPFAGAGDVDTSIEILGQSEMFLACPEYFNRSIGDAGRVVGGAVQDGNHN